MILLKSHSMPLFGSLFAKCLDKVPWIHSYWYASFQTLCLSYVGIFVGCAMNSHDVRVYNKTFGYVVHSSKVKFVKSNVSLGGKVGSCV